MNAVKFKAFFLPILILWGAFPASGQVDTLLKASQPKAEEIEKKAPELSQQLTKWKAETEVDLQELEVFFQQQDSATQEATETKYLNRRRIYEQTLSEISKHVLILEEQKEAAEALIKAQENAKKGEEFDHLPPYSILLLDELREKREVLLGKQASNRSSTEILKTTLNELLEESKQTGEKVASLQATKDLDAEAKWALQSAKAKQRLLFIRASMIQALIAKLDSVLSSHQIDLGAVSQQIKQIGNQFLFSKEDLLRIQTDIENREKQFAKELSEVLKRQRKASQENSLRVGELSKLKASTKEAAPEILMAELHVETNSLQIASLESISESLDDLRQIESIISEAYEARFALFHAKKEEEKVTAINSLKTLSRRLTSWQVVTHNELSAISADVGKQQSRLATVPSEDPQILLLNRQLSSLLEKQVFLQRVNQSLIGNIRILSHWLKELDAEEKIQWHQSLKKSGIELWSGVKKLWNFPLKKYEKTIEEDGVKVTQTHSVSLGLIITALLLFSIAYFLLSRISKRVQRILVERKLVGENQARTIRTWVMMILSFLLALLTLNWLSIPLTIFAFLAGALAIGLGFGAQTIIKNFISGILLLVERNVRVGDIVEVDGTKGTVSEINIRSSILKGFNGVEYLIPNSFFLENRVTNWTLNSRQLRCDMQINLPSYIPVKFATETLKETVERHGLILDTPLPLVLFSSFTETVHGYTLLFWIELNERTNRDSIESEIRMMIQKRMSEYSLE